MPITNNIRVIQLIDSLDAGGGERMAVNLANALADKVQFSGLVCTRKEGALKEFISSEVGYKFINRKKTIDTNALFLLIDFVKHHQVQIIHAHSTSFFFAVLAKIRFPKLKIVWHDHYGESERLSSRPKLAIKLASYLFSSIISVNEKLKNWAIENLASKPTFYTRNFAQLSSNASSNQNLLGDPQAYKIIQVANLRPQKTHLVAFEAIKMLNQKGVNCSLHCLGGFQPEDLYYKELTNFIITNKLSNQIHLYGSSNEISSLTAKANLGMLSSRSEGLPVSLLEYAMAKKPVVVTDVGQCAEVVGDFGKVVPPNNAVALADAIQFYIENPTEAEKDATALHKKVSKEFNPETIIQQVIEVYRT